MGWVNNQITKARTAWTAARMLAGFSVGSTLPSEVRSLFTLSTLDTAGIAISPELIFSVSAAKRAVDLLSTIATVPLVLYRRKQETRRGRPYSWYEEATDDPRYHVLRYEPAADMDAVEFWESVIAQMVIHGDAWVWKGSRMVRGETLPALRLIEDPDSIRAERDRKSPLSDIRYVSARNGNTLQRPDWMRFRWTSHDGVRSGGLKAWAAGSLGVSAASQNAFAAFLRNGMLSGGIVAPDQPLNDKQWEQLQKDFSEHWHKDSPGGWQNAGRLYLPPVPIRMQASIMTGRDSQLLEARRFQVADVGRFCGIPAFMLSDEVAVVRANAQVGETGFVKYTLRPLAARLELAVKRQFLNGPDDGDLVCMFDLAQLSRGDRVAELEGDKLELETAQATPNELRSRRLRPPHDHDDADKPFYASNNLTPIGESPRSAATPPTEREPPVDPREEEDEEDDDEQ